MVELVNLENWKKQKEILDELYKCYRINISSREWRHQVTKWNEEFANGNVGYCIIQSSKSGFKATTNLDEALVAINDFNSRIAKMFKRKRNIIVGFERLNMCKLNLEMED